LSVSESTHYYAYLNLLLSRATGGSDVAASPNQSHGDLKLPQGPAAPGAREVLEWVTDARSSLKVSRVAFLVGGPGNGKSELSAEAVSTLTPVGKVENKIALRNYRYILGTKELLLINDATIGLGSQDIPNLCEQINDSVIERHNVIVNANRGVIFEELYDGPHGIGKLILEWLATDGSPSIDFSKEDYEIVTQEWKGFIATCEINHKGQTIAAVAVCFMDSCSLLEIQPKVTALLSESDSFRFTSQEYEITQFRKRTNADMVNAPAAALLSKVVNELRTIRPEKIGDSQAIDVVGANLDTLNSEDIQRNFISAIRAGEIASSRLITYRELWGAIVRAILGDTSQSAEQKIHEVAPMLSSFEGTKSPLQRLYAQMELADRRLFQAIFGESQSHRVHVTQIDEPVLRLTRKVDPVRDVSPAWSTPIVSAFALSTQDSSPLKDLQGSISGQIGLNDKITHFDRELDSLYCSVIWLPELKDKVRYEITSWYGRYLTRLLAISLGKVAFQSEIESWTQTWVRQEFSEELNSGLKTLLLPTSGNNDNSLNLPVFASRTTPITGATAEPSLVLKVEKGWKLVPKRKGEALFVDLVEDGKTVVTLELDFALMREALACEGPHSGITEYVNATSPRLERFRAVLLIPQRGKRANYWILSAGGDQPLFTGANEHHE